MGKIFEWAHFKVDDMNTKETVSGSLAELLGIKKDTATKVLGLISEADYEATITRWKVVDPPGDGAAPAARAPTLAEYGAAKLVGNLCRIHSGAQMTVEQLRQAASKLQTTAPAASQSSTSPQRKFKLSAVSLQVDETEIGIADEKSLMACYSRYQLIFGKGEMPPKDTEPTGEQISAVKHLLESNVPPYVGFSVYGPFAQRMQKRIKLSGVTLGRDGVLRSVELQGPASIAVCLAQLLSRPDDNTGYAPRGGPRCTDEVCQPCGTPARSLQRKSLGILYQADVRCRLELMERTRRNMQTDHEEALKAGKTTEFDPKRPWNAVWAKVVNNEAFWREEIIEPAMMILAKVARLNDMVQCDAVTAKASPAVAPREEQPLPAQMARAAPTAATIRPRNSSRTGASSSS